MPEFGRYEKKPRPASVTAFKRALVDHSAVDAVEDVNDHVLVIRRKGNRPDLRAYLTNVYTLGRADVDEIMAEDDDTDVIVSFSAWSNYTSDAKEEALARGVGLFKFGEALGAIHYVGSRFLNYTPRDPDEKRRKRAG